MESRQPIYPGQLLRKELRDGSVTDFARHIGVSRVTLSRLLNEASGMSAAMAVKLSEAFPHTEAETWMEAQLRYDLELERRKKRRPVPVWLDPMKS